jgi:hypothetical protein
VTRGERSEGMALDTEFARKGSGCEVETLFDFANDILIPEL